MAQFSATPGSSALPPYESQYEGQSPNMTLACPPVTAIVCTTKTSRR